MVSPNPHLISIARDSERQPLRDEFLHLDRNERISALPETAFRDMLSRISPATFSSYPCYPPLYERLSAYTGIAQDRLCVTSGSDGAIRRLFQVFVRPGDRVVMGDPTYAMYAIYSQIFQATAVPVPYGRELRLDVEAFLDAIMPGTRIVALVNPSQPTGSTLSPTDIERIVTAAARVDALCIVDEAYHPFYPETALPLISKADNLVVTRSFSKIGGIAGLRLGFLAASPDIVGLVEKVRGASEVNAMAVLVGSYLLEHPEIMEEFRAQVSVGRAVVKDAAHRLGLETPECHGNFQLISLPEGLDPSAVAHGLYERKILIKSTFAAPLHRCIRVTLDEPSIMEHFVSALESVITDLRAS